jgi:demethylmenaquinone methyltransferase/2-methoxy-6-polyprenyl-1,4-benzoquinol methylase
MGNYFLHPESIRRLFDRVAPRYDFLNHLLSLRRDIYWRQVAVRKLRGVEGWILDVATGTGDIAVEVIRQESNGRRVAGLDFSEPMIRGARRKLLKKNLLPWIGLSLGDALSLPFRDETFGATLVAFGLRNILEKEEALSEMVRVTKQGGKVIILEFTLPEKGWMKSLYPFYFMKVLPWVGGLISGDPGAYTYLPESVFHFRSSEHYEQLMKKSGLEEVASQRLTCGIASLVVGTKGLR